jgi:outer membrane protein assembly factor BamB
MLRQRTPLEKALWASGRLNDKRQAALDAACGHADSHVATCQLISARTDTYDVVVQDPQSGAIRQRIALPPASGRFRARPASEGDAIVLITGAFQKAGELALEEPQGICLYRQQPLRFAGAALSAPYLGWGQLAHSSLGAAAGSNFGPLDLVVRPSGQEALVIDRCLGLAHHLDLNAGTIRYSLSIRQPGGTSQLHVAWVGTRLVVVDPAAGSLHRYDLHEHCALYAPSELGHLLNVVASPDGHTLYLLGATPRFGVIAVDADTFKKAWAVPLKGEPFNRSDGTQSIVGISPDGRHLAILSAIHSPEPQTPLLTGLSTEDGSTQRLARLPAGRRPLALAFATENPFHAEHQRVAEALLSLGFISRDELGQVLASLQVDNPPVPAPESGEAAVESGPPPDLASLIGDGPWRRVDTAPAAPLALPARLDTLIADFLHQRFRGQTGRDCRQSAKACHRILEAATAARKRLEHAAGTQVELAELLPQVDLHAFVGREQVQEWLAIITQVEAVMVESLSSLAEAEDLTVPETCPSCQGAVRGQVRCLACGHEIISAATVAAVNAALRPKDRLLPNTTDPQLFLPPGHLLIADPPRQRVIQLNRHGRIVWHIAADRSHPVLENLLKWPIDALRLPNEHTLVIDRVGRRVFEVTPEGRPYWEWPTSAGALREPVRVARNEWGESFIVDRLAHRIWRADANGEPMAGYGKGHAGIGPGELCSPTDLQVLPDGRSIITDSGNHRIIELLNGDIVWQYGNTGNEPQGGAGSGKGQLNAPRRAMRLEKDRTLILDAGNHRILLVDRAGGVLWQYDTAGGERATAMERPTGLARLGPDRLACWDARCLIELDFTGTILWAGLFQQLEANPRLHASDGDTAGRRLWHVERLADDDPDRTQTDAEMQQRRSAVTGLRQAWREGNLSSLIKGLRALSRKRLAADASKPWRIDLARVEDLADENRDRLRDRLSPFAAKPAKPKPAEAAVPAAVPADEPASVLRGPLPVVAAQPFASRVVHLDLDQTVRWRWGDDALNEPEAAVLLPNGRVLVADTYNHRVLEIDLTSNAIVWETTAELGIRYPKGVARLANGNTLIADAGNHRALELKPDLSVAWEWRHVGRLRMPTSCERTPTGTTLITDQGSHVVTEVSADGEVVWTHGFPGTPSRSDGFLHHPVHAVRRPSGNTLITNGQCNQVIEVDPDGTVVWRYDGLGENRLINPTYVLEQGKSLWIVHDEGRQIFEVSRAGKVLWRAAPPRRGP